MILFYHVNAMCIVSQDDVGGLQVLVADEWVDVPPRPDCFVINLGEMMQV